MDTNWLIIWPPLLVFMGAAVGVLTGIFLKQKRFTVLVSLLGLLLAFVINLLFFFKGAPLTAFGESFWVDGNATMLNLVIIIATAMTLLLSLDAPEGWSDFEYYPLLLFSATGAMIMAGAGDFVTLLLGLEILSLPVYVLSAWRTNDPASEAAGIKYFLLGAFASAFFIYGIALYYGATGSVSLLSAPTLLHGASSPHLLLASLAGAFLLAGMGFKAALAPFHQWTPDIYIGAPTPVTAFMSVVVKAAAFIALVRISAFVFPYLSGSIHDALALLVGLTLLFGNFGALIQTRLKALLAYSAVAHAGYLGLGVLGAMAAYPTFGELATGTHSAAGDTAVVWYLLAYTFMNLGAFAVLHLLERRNAQSDDIASLAGLGQRAPLLAATLTVFLLSLAGIPPLAGFIAKVLVFQSAFAAGYSGVAVVGILTSVVGLYYYLRVIITMYFTDPVGDARESDTQLRALPQTFRYLLLVCVAMTVILGVLPGIFLGLLEHARF